MANGANALLVGRRRRVPASGPGRSWRPRGHRLLAAVAGAFTLAQLLLVRPGMGLGWDETVYVSQVAAQAPPAFFSAPRARGVTLLVAPMTSWSTSTELLRIYLALASGLGLYLALRVWRGLFPARVVAVAGDPAHRPPDAHRRAHPTGRSAPCIRRYLGIPSRRPPGPVHRTDRA